MGVHDFPTVVAVRRCGRSRVCKRNPPHPSLDPSLNPCLHPSLYRTFVSLFNPHFQPSIHATMSGCTIPCLCAVACVQMIGVRVCFTRSLLPVLVSVPLAWFQGDRLSVPPSVACGLWTLCLHMGHSGRRSALSCMFGLLDSRPQGSDSHQAKMQWLQLRDSMLAFLAARASDLCGVPPPVAAATAGGRSSSTPAGSASPGALGLTSLLSGSPMLPSTAGAVDGGLDAPASRSILLRLFVNGILEGSVVSGAEVDGHVDVCCCFHVLCLSRLHRDSCVGKCAEWL